MLTGGAISDRVESRKLRIGLECVLAVTALILAGLAWSGAITIWQVAAVTFVAAAANSLEIPARTVLVLRAVGEKDFPNAVGLNSAMLNLARLLGPAVAGAVIVVAGGERSYQGEAVCFALNALSYLATIVTLFLMRLPPVELPAERQRLDSSILAGFRYAWQEPRARFLLLLIAIPSFLAQPYTALMPVFARDVLQMNAASYGLLASAIGAGAVVGALVSGTFDASQRRSGLVTASIVYPVLLVLFALSRSLPLSLAFMFLAATGQAVQSVVIFTMLQLTAADEYRGRITSLFALLQNGMARVAGVPFGAVAQAGSVTVALLIGASLCLAATIVVLPRVSAEVSLE